MGFDKFNPIGELIALQDRMNNLLTDALSSATLANDRTGLTWSPPVDFFETENAFFLVAELPGLVSDDVDIQIEDNLLILSGNRHRIQKERQYYRRERFQGNFRRTFSLPAEVQMDAIAAEMKNGILEVKLPKSSKSGGKKLKVEIKK